ncbi:SGNH/GDSL hydrolase family protein [Campylobacter estrildidarum]|uniref:DUF459 domain-containing protein n=1 Tax=Campylobacter estrildidarum TaxID=2510189 RepID=A0A4U7BSI4_9BACT|nr:DUF459 domain-containing protein [Campylobacter estrildidarum]TKX32006.1 DUF459 domain-containing protein [Campylobacter estrildidarum]
MKIVKFFFILVTVFLLVLIVMNQSISLYIEQKYHFIFYPQNDILKEANGFKIKLEQIRAILSNEPLPRENIEIETQVNNKTIDIDNHTDLNTSVEQNFNKTAQEENTTLEHNINFSNHTRLEVDPNQEFLFIGDSLMQGVAVALNKNLRNLGLKATDISRQNTGLSYKSYFNWAQATKETLSKNPNIKYLVILLGANDPWDIKKGGNYLHFGTPPWKEIYTSRVDEIIKIAQKHKVKILWFEIPPVKKDSLNKKIQILNEIYNQELVKNKEIFINTKLSFSVDNEYSTYIKDENNKSIKMRTDDGIHFTSNGAKVMSKLLLDHIEVKDKNVS